MSWTQAELDALRRAYAAGALRVTFGGKSVEYGSEADLRRRIALIEAEMAAQAGHKRPNATFATFRSARR